MDLFKHVQEITGYSSIEKLKAKVVEAEISARNAREAVNNARNEYTRSETMRASYQRELAELLQRRSEWQNDDLERFTELCRNDHRLERLVAQARDACVAADENLEACQNELVHCIGARYREEQLWSDRIRQASTWGTWILLGVNILVFILVQLIVEPWKRRRLVASFEDKVHAIIVEATSKQSLNTDAAAGTATGNLVNAESTAADDDATVDQKTSENDTAPADTQSQREPEDLTTRLQQPWITLSRNELSAIVMGSVAISSASAALCTAVLSLLTR